MHKHCLPFFQCVLDKGYTLFFENKGLPLDVGDNLPIILTNCNYAVGHSKESDSFVIAGIIDTGEEMDDSYSLSISFPLILKKEDYFTCLRHTGIRCDTMNSSIKAILKEYKDYCQLNSIEYNLNDDDFNMNNLIPYSTFRGLYKKYSSDDTIYENDGFVYYLGDLPSNENWVMVPDDNSNINALYDLLQESVFFSKYKVGDNIEIPLTDNFQLIDYSQLKTFSIRGLYLVNDTSLVMKDCLIISDSLFEKLLTSISDSTNHKDFVSVNISYADKSWLKENQQLILTNRSIVFRSSSFTGLFKSFDNLIRLQSFIFVLSIIICVLSLLFSLIYFINLRNQFTKDFAVLTLLGISHLEKFRILLISISPLIFGSYILSLSFSELISESLISILTANSGFTGKTITSNAVICYTIQLLTCLLLLLLTFALSEIRKKKADVSTIKENKS